MENLIKRILKESVSEIETQQEFNEFHNFFKLSYGKTPNFEEIFERIVTDISNSPTPKITLTDRGMFCGLSLTDNVILSKSIFNRSIFGFIFVLFHEIAHQYQYKKYGKNLLYDLTTNEITDDTLNKLIEIEKVADRFGENMANKYAKMFNIPKTPIASPYSNVEYGKNTYRNLILKIQEEIKKGNISCVEQMESFMIEHLTRANTYVYTGSTYGGYGSYGGYSGDYGRSYGGDYGKYPSRYGSYDYDDDEFYARNYEKYEKGEVEDYTEEIIKTYEPKLIDLIYEIQSEINQIAGEVEDLYGEEGLNIFIDLINEEGFTKFHYYMKTDTGSGEVDGDLLYEVDENFYSVVIDLKKYVEESLHEMMDEVEKTYSWDGVGVLSELISGSDFDDLFLNY
jgi:hypothetical protein